MYRHFQGDFLVGGKGLRGWSAVYAKVILLISTIYSTAFVIHGSFLRNWDKRECKEPGIDEGTKPLTYVIKTYEIRNSLGKLNCKLRIFLLMKMFVKLKVLVAFLSNQKIVR